MKKILNHYLLDVELDPGEKHILGRLIARQKAHDAIVPDDPHASRGFLRIERVAKSEPVSLFGQSVRSFAHNRIVICFGVEGEGGETVPGAPLMTALISEESLAQLMMSPNRSNQNVALTAESWLGETMPQWSDRRPSPDELLDAAMGDTLASRRGAVDALKLKASDLKGPLSKARQRDMAILLDQVLAKSDAKFRLQRHSDNLQRILVQSRVEASTAALNIDGIARSAQSEPLLLEGGAEITDPSLARDRNGMLNAAMERYTPEEAKLAYKAVITFMQKIIKDDFPDCAYVPGSNDPHGQRLRMALRDDDRARAKQLEHLASLAANLANPHVDERRAAADGHGLTASCAFIEGGDHALHASFPSANRGFFSFRIETAVVENSFGNEKIRDGSRIVELGLSPEDMMTALRGHPTGADIPCSIDNVAGISLSRPKLEGNLEAIVNSGAADPIGDETLAEFTGLIAQAKDVIKSGAKRASDRKQLEDLVDRIDIAMEAFSGFELRNVQDRARSMNDIVQDMNRKSLQSINDYVLERNGSDLPMILSQYDDDALPAREL
jgi:hypothetical protein